jgi:hypothetical protein
VFGSARDSPLFVASSDSFLFFPDNGVSLPGSRLTLMVTFSTDACAAFAACRAFIMSYTDGSIPGTYPQQNTKPFVFENKLMGVSQGLLVLGLEFYLWRY